MSDPSPHFTPIAVNRPFWTSARILLTYKRLIALSFGGALLTACTFGAGLGMILPISTLLLRRDATIRDLVHDGMVGPDRAAWLDGLGRWLLTWLPADPLAGFATVMGGVIVLTVIGSVGTYIRELAAITVAMRAAKDWRTRMFRRLINAPLPYMLVRGGGDQISRLMVDTGVLSRGYLHLLGRTMGKLFGGLAALVVAFTINWRLTLLAMVCLPLLAYILRKFGKIVRRATRRVLHQQGRMVSTVGESMAGLRVVKAHNAEGSERRRFAVINRAVFREELRARRVRAMTSPLLGTLVNMAMAAVAGVAAWMIFERGVAPEEFLTVLAALAGATTSVKPISKLNNQLHEASAAARRVLEIVSMPAEPGGVEQARTLPALPRHRREIVFDHVGYTYPGAEHPAISGISLTVPHGRAVAVVGGNGSGKTTLLSLLPRLMEPSTGRILIDGVDIAGARLRSLRRQLGVVTQDAVLFQGSIADNIAYGQRHVRRERIVAAARAAYAHDFIAALPNGYDTQLAEGGTGLSGGQRQRVCIARAVLRDPAIMILDEATSQIDSESEAKINQAVHDLRRNRTTFVIAHRLSTVIDADLIVVMDGGRIVDQGTHDELLERCRVYRLLTQTQLRPSAAGAEDRSGGAERSAVGGQLSAVSPEHAQPPGLTADR